MKARPVDPELLHSSGTVFHEQGTPKIYILKIERSVSLRMILDRKLYREALNTSANTSTRTDKRLHI